MSSYLTRIDCARNCTLNLTQYISFRFLNYLLYNAYVLHRVMDCEEEVDLCAQGSSSDFLSSLIIRSGNPSPYGRLYAS